MCPSHRRKFWFYVSYVHFMSKRQHFLIFDCSCVFETSEESFSLFKLSYVRRLRSIAKREESFSLIFEDSERSELPSNIKRKFCNLAMSYYYDQKYLSQFFLIVCKIQNSVKNLVLLWSKVNRMIP